MRTITVSYLTCKTGRRIPSFSNSHSLPSLLASPLYTLTIHILVIFCVGTSQIHPDMYNKSDNPEVFKEHMNIIALEKIINWWIIEHHQRKPNQMIMWGRKYEKKDK